MADQPHEYPQGYGYQQPQQSVIQQQPGTAEQTDHDVLSFSRKWCTINVRKNNTFCEMLMLLANTLDVKTGQHDNISQKLQVL